MPGPLPVPRQLSEAVSAGDVETFARLMREHPEHVWDDPRTRAQTRWLFAAANEGQLPLIQLLVAAGADINAPKAGNGSPERVSRPPGIPFSSQAGGYAATTREVRHERD